MNSSVALMDYFELYRIRLLDGGDSVTDYTDRKNDRILDRLEKPLQKRNPRKADVVEVDQSRPVFLRTVGSAQYYISMSNKNGERKLRCRAANTREAVASASGWKLLTADNFQIENQIAAELSKGSRLTATVGRTLPGRRRRCPRSHRKQAIQTISSDVMRLAFHKIKLAIHAGTPDGGRLRGTYVKLGKGNQIIMAAREDKAETAAKIMRGCMLSAYNMIVKPVIQGAVKITISDRG